MNASASAAPVTRIAFNTFDAASGSAGPRDGEFLQLAQADAAPGEDAPEQLKKKRRNEKAEKQQRGEPGGERAERREAPEARDKSAAKDGGEAAPQKRQGKEKAEQAAAPDEAPAADQAGRDEAPRNARKADRAPGKSDRTAEPAAQDRGAEDGAPRRKGEKSQKNADKRQAKPADAEGSANVTPQARPANEPVPEEKPGRAEPDKPVPATAPKSDEAPAAGGNEARDAGKPGAEPDAVAQPAENPSDAPAPRRRGEANANDAGETSGNDGQAREQRNEATAPGEQRQRPRGDENAAGQPNGAAGQADNRRGSQNPQNPPAEQPQPVPAATQDQPVEPGRINASDARVQKLQQPVEVTPITQEKGERIEPPAGAREQGNGRDRNGREARDRRDGDRFDPARGELPPGVKVVKREGDRDILTIVGAAAAGAVAGAAASYFIKSDNDSRVAVDSRNTYYDRLPRGEVRQTIVRDNGVQVVTITNRYGEIIRRSRIMPDGREVVLFYDPYSGDEARPTYELDPGRDLPPLRIDIPENEYIVDVSRPDEKLYYATLIAPPVETVNRIYSVDEVVRSERIRDKVRRIDLNTINFDFGSDAIGQNQVGNLKALGEAINEVIDKNPGETFLIEGHTDAVGSQLANLALSDRRAEAVASALTQYFDVPPENLVTQGYGEEDLKVDTQDPNRENRRVTVRRITPLVKPVESARN
ncbi:OmpA family protein [Jiella sp. KSK16Y-1]|uniref:OmpA family protein n=2 Tax=Jiella mangrovi TaxID=2821407 RepID=A0ABS4BJD5_9HYPH|nr:OmpA family protein [Jiella mangrovi]